MARDGMFVVVRAWFSDGKRQYGVRVWGYEHTRNKHVIDFYVNDLADPSKFWESPAEKRSTKEVRQWIEKKLKENRFVEGVIAGVYAKGTFHKKEDWLDSVLDTVRTLNIRSANPAYRR